MHKHRQTVIDRAIDQNRKITDADVSASNTLCEVALDFVASYRGHNNYVQAIAIWLADHNTLSIPQMRGALNVMIAEARIDRERATVAAADDDNGEPYIDLRPRAEKEREAAGTPPADASGSETGHSVPNGFYTVLIDGDPNDYVTLRLTDAPDYFKAAAGTQIAAYLCGADNTSDYAGFAFVYGDTVKPWKKSLGRLDRQINALHILLSRDPMIAAAEYVKRSNRCFVCNRPLTTPDSIAAGIGPICRERLAVQGFAFNLPGDRDQAHEHVTLEDMIGARVKCIRQTRGEGTDADHDGSPLVARPAATITRNGSAAERLRKAQSDIDELFPE